MALQVPVSLIVTVDGVVTVPNTSSFGKLPPIVSVSLVSIENSTKTPIFSSALSDPSVTPIFGISGFVIGFI